MNRNFNRNTRTLRRRRNRNRGNRNNRNNVNRTLIRSLQFKAFYTHFSNITVTSAGVMQNINIIDQGLDITNRVGRQINITRITIRGHYEIANGLANSPQRQLARIILFRDKQANQAAPTGTDLLYDNTIDDAINSPYNLDNRHRFHVVFDKAFVFSSAFPIHNIFFNINANIAITFDASTSSVSDQTSNAYYLFFVSDNSVSGPTFNGYSVVRFTDS